jgi:ABC-type branched-subunit amino acid transport system substrate-binding protein
MSSIQAPRRIAVLIAILTAGCVLVLQLSAAAGADAIGPLRIASAQPLTGSLSGIGLGLQRGAQLAIDEHVPVLGVSVEHVAFDSGCGDRDMAVGAAGEIVSDPSIVAVVGEACSAHGSEWVPIFESAGVPVVSQSATDPSLPAYGPTTFNRVFVPEPGDEAWHARVLTLPSVADFANRYDDEFGTAPPVFAEMGYDAALTILRALDRVAHVEDGRLVVDRKRLARAIRTTDGLLGVTCKITFDADGNRQDKPQQLARCGATP